MRFVCLGFYDEAAFAKLSEADVERMFQECFAYDDVLRRGGHFLGGDALEPARTARTLRNKNGQVQVTDGPFAETKESLGGILLLEARDLDHAVELMSQHPAVRVFGLTSFVIHPTNEAMNKLVADRSAAVAREG